MDYIAAQRYLLALGNEVAAMKLGLDNIARLLVRLDSPHANYQRLQIVGTNGKGSTAAMLANIACAAHIKTGLYTSPHLARITERIRINGVEISEAEFAACASLTREAAHAVEDETGSLPTFFEQVTAIALTAFERAGIQLAVLETGLGGRLDAVTATRAGVIGITSVALDHQSFLGDTIYEIASDKAAAINADTRIVIVAPQHEDACQAVSERLKTSTAQAIFLHAEDAQIARTDARGKATINFVNQDYDFYNLQLNLAGRHQVTNAQLAVELALTLNADDANDSHKAKPLISEAAIRRGLSTVQHPGRLEWIDVKDRVFILDGAHNEAGAWALANYLREYASEPLTFIFGAMRDKDLAQMSDVLFPKADRLILTTADNSRAMAATELLDFIPAGIDRKNVFLAGNVEDALKKACELSSEDGLICVTGSLYLVGEAQKILSSEFKL